MECKTVDLYEYFGVKKPEGAKGYLKTYLYYKSPEFCETRLRPAMLIVPGGGYAFCSDREAEPVAVSFLEKGFNSFVLDYSVKPVSFPAQLIEGAMAVAYIKENADKFGIFQNKVCAVGFSAGGHLVGMLGNIFNHKVIKDALKEKANLVRPDAIILSYPVISAFDSPHINSFKNLTGNNEKLYRELTLEDKVTKDSSPAFIWSTYTDSCVPVKNSMLIANSYLENGVEYELHIFNRGQHGLSLSTIETCCSGMDDVSKNVLDIPHTANWVKLSVEWLKSLGFKIQL